MKYEIGAMVEAKSASLIDWYEGQIVGYDDSNDIYVLRMCEEYPFTPYAGFSEDRIREVSEPELIRFTVFDIYSEQPKQNLEDAQIEAKAEELYKIYTDEYNSHFSNVLSIEWSLVPHECKEGFRAIARHLATPQSDVQHALQAALESERELMDILRKIGKVFGKNVGTDIGILDLPKLVEGEIAAKIEMKSSYREMKEERRKALSELEAHKHNSKQILKLNNWLQENHRGEWGDSVTDTIIELLENYVKPKPAGSVTLHLSPADVESLDFKRTGGPEQLIKTLVKRTQRLRDIEANYRELSKRVAEAYTYIPADR